MVLAVVACGSEALDRPCSIECLESCPGGMTCSAGFCATDRATCEPSFERVATGTGFACATDQYDRAWCWGANGDRQLEDSARPFIGRAIVVGERRWDSISVGGGHVCALEDAELWCWGRNDRSQVTGTITGDVPLPIRIEVAGETISWSFVSTGFDYTCAIGDGRLFCWGSGEVGKLGTGTTDDANTPRPVLPSVRDWTAVSTGARHTCAVSAASGVFCWGDGSQGQLGNGRFNVLSTPQEVGLAEVSSIAVGLNTTCAVTVSGELHCWGRAFDGALGDPAIVDPDGEDTAVPVLASNLGGWIEVESAERYACARRDTEVWCWGSARSGGIGDGRWLSERAWNRVLEGATDLDVGWNATVFDAQRDDGDYDLSCAVVDAAVKCWGDNRTAQLGQGASTRSDLPAEIAGAQVWSSIVAGSAHACGIAGGDAFCWGSAELGQATGVAAGRTSPCTPERCDEGAPVKLATATTALATGEGHTCALRGATITCWGDNGSGQCGAAPSSAVTPRDLPGTWSALHAGGANGTCAVSGSETWCWGSALALHEPAHEAVLDGATTIALGAGFGCALDATSVLVCFGDAANAFGNGGLGTCGDNACNAGETAFTCEADCGAAPLTHLGRAYTAIDSGGRPFACGLRSDGGVECWGDNLYGQSGELDEGMRIIHPVTTPFVMPGLAGCTQLAAGDKHACAICGGALACWGDASHGELGAPISVEAITTPRPIAIPLVDDTWVEVTAGDGFTCGRTQIGKGYCWGSSLHGALGNGVTGANLPVTVQR